MTPDRAAAERVAREIRLSACTCNAPGFADLCPHNAITTALLAWGAQRWREAIERARREVWTRKCLQLCSHPECTRLQVVDKAIRALLPPPGEGTP